MKRIIIWTLLMLPLALMAQEAETTGNDLPVKWEELTAPDFVKAVERSDGTCVIPLGILEKHGPHLPLGTDLISVRETALRAAEKEFKDQLYKDSKNPI